MTAGPPEGPLGRAARRVRSRLRALVNRRGLETDLDDELRFHLDMETDYQMRMGLPESEARRRATREFGGVERYRDESRDARGVGSLEDLIRDAKVSLRSLRRAPAFALVSIFTVCLGIGTTTAAFSIVDGVLLRPLPYPDADAVVRVYERTDRSASASVSAANFYDVERVATTLAAAAYFGAGTETILGMAQPLRVGTAYVSDRFFDVMGIPPKHGRGFTVGGSRGDDANGIVVSERFWQTWLSARPDWQNATLRAGDISLRVIGIMPSGFSYPTGSDLWVLHRDDSPSRTSHNWSVIARLKPDASIQQTQAELDRHFAALKAELGRGIDASGVTIRTLHEALTVDVRTPMLLLLAAVGFVLLVACVNLASANLARGESQQREIAVRASLGASRARLIRQLATEKVVLCLAGGVLGIALAWGLVRIAVSLGAGTIPAFASVSVDLRVMLFGLLMAVVTGLVTGIIPALRVTSDLRGIAASGGGGAGKRSMLRGPLIASEIALATTLLIGAGLLIRSFGTLMSEDPGYRVEQVVLGDVALPSTGYRNPAGPFGDTVAIQRFFSTMLARMRAAPGEQQVSVINQIPLGAVNFNTGLMLDGGTDASRASADYRVIDSAYFSTMGIPLVRGRVFTSRDNSGAEHVAIINREAAEKFWPGQNPLGHRLRPPGMDLHRDVWLTVVGVVDNIRQYALDQPVSSQLYVHYLQRPERLMSASVVVKTDRPQAMAPIIRAAAAEADRNAVVDVKPMQALVDQSVSGRRFSMTVMSLFSGLALFLAAVGIYGVLAYAVVQRQREIGVRMALGLTRGGVGRLILGDAMRAVAPGVAIGLVGAYLATRFIQGMLYGIAPVDPLTYVVTPAIILGVALLASLYPASRASRVDPIIAMRAE